ncbi:phage baseplate assembly protein V [Aliidiomarina sanyensis]|uniref:Phage baseplate assembly protein V n=1 Tax=Aliidiomarina sanyensis TaxID=1249555 RepID=A0A432WBB4_9GAMM|nr:phage baseplate assembly protein V [Aliidiomarina sanyensis]RUO28192.1 phage baseplate assembly protein V [Aliidiomarina sanyensis]
MREKIAELNRRIDNMIRIGVVEEAKAGKVRVRTGKILTDWRPYLVQRAGASKRSWRISVGEQVVLLSLCGDLANCYVLPAINSNENPEQDDHENRDHITYPDGAVIEYDPETSFLKVTGVKNAEVQASERVKVDCPETETTGNLTVGGNAIVKGTTELQGAATMKDTATVTGALAANGGAAIKSGASVDGGLKIDGDDYSEHQHAGVTSGSSTTGPVA